MLMLSQVSVENPLPQQQYKSVSLQMLTLVLCCSQQEMNFLHTSMPITSRLLVVLVIFNQLCICNTGVGW